MPHFVRLGTPSPNGRGQGEGEKSLKFRKIFLCSRGRRPRRPAPSMRGVCPHFLKLSIFLHNKYRVYRNQPHFRNKFSHKKRKLIFGFTQFAALQYITLIGTSALRTSTYFARTPSD